MNFNLCNHLRGDNSVDMMPCALDNGESNLTMANQIFHIRKNILKLMGILVHQMM